MHGKNGNSQEEMIRQSFDLKLGGRGEEIQPYLVLRIAYIVLRFIGDSHLCSCALMYLFDLNRATWRQEIQPFAEELVFQDCRGRLAIKLQLPAIKFSPLGDFLSGYSVGLEIYNQQARRTSGGQALRRSN